MKKLLLFLTCLSIFIGCVNHENGNNSTDTAVQKKAAGNRNNFLFQPSAIKVPYDSAYVDVCNTVHIPVPYDSAYSYTILKPDTVVKKKKYRDGNRTIITQVPVTINTSKIAYWDSAVTTCHTRYIERIA
jgi:hypothetical protein